MSRRVATEATRMVVFAMPLAESRCQSNLSALFGLACQRSVL